MGASPRRALPFRLLAITPPRGEGLATHLEQWLKYGLQAHDLAVLLRSPDDTAIAAVGERGRLSELLAACQACGVTSLLSCAPAELPEGVTAVERLGISGLQLRQDPTAQTVARARGLLGAERLLGASVHGEPRPAPGALDYVCVAPVFRPFSAPGKEPLGLEGLSGWVRAAGCPVVALGGIDPARAGRCLAAGAAALAGITTFFGEPAQVAQDVGALARLPWPAG